MNLSRKLTGQNSRHPWRTRAPKACWALALLAPIACSRSPSARGAARGLEAGPSYADTVRFLEQATFGPTPALAGHVQEVGFDAFLSEQFDLPASQFPSACYPESSCGPGEFLVVTATPPPTCVRQGPCLRDNYSMWPLQKIFFQNALGAADQVRQRVFFALDQILVTSAADADLNYPHRMTGYLNVLERDAFGNFKDLLRDVTLNAAMGRYLDLIDNAASIGINENYARELLQLFSIGLFVLNPDGTQALDNQGHPIPTYDQQAVVELSRALSGWVLGAQVGPGLQNFSDPLRLGAAARHDDGAKVLFGVELAAGQGAEANLEQVIDIIFRHPNVGPFIGRSLIARLVTSNPSPGYVFRVASAFNDNGAAVRGDMKAVVRAILLDTEARNLSPDADAGKLREPVLAVTNLLRSFDGDVTTDYALSDFSLSFGNTSNLRLDEDVFRSPTVFNFYPADFPLPGYQGLIGPEFGIQSTTTSLGRMNLFYTMIYQAMSTDATYRPSGTRIDTSALAALADTDAIVEAVNQQLLGGRMSPEMRAVVAQTVASAPSAQARAREAVYLIATSSAYQVQR